MVLFAANELDTATPFFIGEGMPPVDDARGSEPLATKTKPNELGWKLNALGRISIKNGHAMACPYSYCRPFSH